MLLDLSSLINSIARLQEGWERYESNIKDTQVRDGLIQRFEFTYEQCHKMLKRYLEMTSPTPEHIDAMAFQDLIRSGYEQQLLLHSWPEWRNYRRMRNETSHTYEEDVALKVVAGIPDFLREAIFLRDKLQERV